MLDPRSIQGINFQLTLILAIAGQQQFFLNYSTMIICRLSSSIMVILNRTNQILENHYQPFQVLTIRSLPTSLFFINTSLFLFAFYLSHFLRRHTLDRCPRCSSRSPKGWFYQLPPVMAAPPILK